MGAEASYHPPAPPKWTRRLDSVFLHPVAGPLVFCSGGGAGVSDHLQLGHSADGWRRLAV